MPINDDVIIAKALELGYISERELSGCRKTIASLKELGVEKTLLEALKEHRFLTRDRIRDIEEAIEGVPLAAPDPAATADSVPAPDCNATADSFPMPDGDATADSPSGAVINASQKPTTACAERASTMGHANVSSARSPECITRS